MIWLLMAKSTSRKNKNGRSKHRCVFYWGIPRNWQDCNCLNTLHLLTTWGWLFDSSVNMEGIPHHAVAWFGMTIFIWGSRGMRRGVLMKILSTSGISLQNAPPHSPVTPFLPLSSRMKRSGACVGSLKWGIPPYRQDCYCICHCHPEWNDPEPA